VYLYLWLKPSQIVLLKEDMSSVPVDYERQVVAIMSFVRSILSPLNSVVAAIRHMDIIHVKIFFSGSTLGL